MMDSVASFLAMGGYARYVWPAYGLAVIVLAGLLLWSLSTYRRRQHELVKLQEARQ